MTTPEFQNIETTLQEGVLYGWLNRPHKVNAMNRTLWFELGDLARWADREPSVRVLVLAGRGRGFTAGIDLSLIMEIVTEAAAHPDGRKQEEIRQVILEMQRAFSAFETCRKPVIAAVHGSCIGGGIDLITACDMRYSTKDTTFCVKEVDLAIVADIGTLQRLPYIVGEGLARELAMTGRSFSGDEALQMRLVNGVYETQEALMQAVGEVARTIASKSPLTVRGIKQVMNHARGRTIEEGLAFVATWNAGMLLSEDAQEAVQAWMEKREPVFRD
jgi:enoyl-CoA hydratase/carnithine racemase